MPVTPRSLADHLVSEGGRVLDFFNRLSDSQWDVIVYQDSDSWNMRQLLAHFVASEYGRKELITDVSSGGLGAPPGFDIDRFNQLEVAKLSCESNISLMDKFWAERESLSDLILRFTDDDLQRTGNDPYLGLTTLENMIKLTYRHLQIHLRDARRCL